MEAAEFNEMVDEISRTRGLSKQLKIKTVTLITSAWIWDAVAEIQKRHNCNEDEAATRLFEAGINALREQPEST